MVQAAIEISPSAVRTRASELRPEGVGHLVDRRVPVMAERANLDRIAAVVIDGAAAARSAGATEIALEFTPDLAGSRIARLIERRVGPFVTGDRSPESGARIATRFMSAAAEAGAATGAGAKSVAVAGLGHFSLGLAVGRPGRAPDWIGSRPVGLDRIVSRVRFQDPPAPVQLDVARSSCIRALGTMQPPDFEGLVVVSEFGTVISEMCGAESSVPELAGAIGWILGRTSDELAAVTGFERQIARLLPAAVAVHLALAESLQTELVPVSPNPAVWPRLADRTRTGGGARERD